MTGGYRVTRTCPGCGPRTVINVRSREPQIRPEFIVCPTCGMDPAEYAYRERILADSAAVYAEEARAFAARRAAERGAA